jgi:hypothetical protein
LGIRSELRTISTALNAGWDVPEEAGIEAIKLARSIVADPTASARDRLRAAETLDSFRRTNMAALSLDLQAEKNEQARPDFAPTVVDIMREVERAEAGMARKGETDAPGDPA